MARGKTLLSLLDDFRAECKLSLNPAHNAQVRDSQVKQLVHTQEWLWEDFAWPHLRVERTFALAAGQRYYSVPEDLDISRIVKIEVKFGGRWLPLTVGVGAEQYSLYDSDIDERSWPIERWRIAEDEQIEFWPIGTDNGNAADLEGYIKITGIRYLRPLVEEADVADLDNRLITLYAAASAITDTKEAQKKLNQANKLYARIRSGLMPRRKFRMFGKQDDRRKLRGPPTVYYRVVP